ncbi:MAG: hypothetical protein IKG23_12280 [Clostridia bacterium]|nr:hypothetical protein [Clostridia bacterium]
MKKIIALLCALLLLSVSCASAAGTVVEFHDKLLLNGTLPDGYSYTQISLDDSTLFGEVTSGNSAGAHLEICISLSDNSSYIVAESPKDLSADELNLIKHPFEEESNVTFDQLTTASGDNLLVVRETGGQFLDFYTVCLGYEIELTLFPAEGTPLTEEQINRCLEFLRTLDVVPIRG